MTWLHNFSKFQQRNTYICEYWLHKTMPDATDDRIRKLEIMIRQIDIDGSPAHQTRQGHQVGLVGGPAWPFLYSFCV
jgi:hypothetical protein